MPNRIIKESIRTSRSVGSLSDFDFRLWIYLITYVDDYGRGSADPELLKGIVFTRRKSVTEAQIYEGIARLASAGMIHLYTVDGEPYMYFPNWASHQRIRNSVEKYPAPPDDSHHPVADSDSSPQSAATCGEPPPESIIQNPESRIQNTESNTRYNDDDNNAREEETPFGTVTIDPLIVKVQKELFGLTDTQYDLLKQYRDSLGAELISYAIDQAVANGSRKWSYVEKILINYEESGVRTVGEAKVANDKHRARKKESSPAGKSQSPPRDIYAEA